MFSLINLIESGNLQGNLIEGNINVTAAVFVLHCNLEKKLD